MSDNTRILALEQSIADLEYIAAHPGNILQLIEKRKADRQKILDAKPEATDKCKVCELGVHKSEQLGEWVHTDTGLTAGYGVMPHHARPQAEDRRPPLPGHMKAYDHTCDATCTLANCNVTREAYAATGKRSEAHRQAMADYAPCKREGRHLKGMRHTWYECTQVNPGINPPEDKPEEVDIRALAEEQKRAFEYRHYE